MIGYCLLRFESLTSKAIHILLVFRIPTLTHLLLELCLFWSVVHCLDGLNSVILWLTCYFFHLTLKTLNLIKMLLKPLPLSIGIKRRLSTIILTENLRWLDSLPILIILISICSFFRFLRLLWLLSLLGHSHRGDVESGLELFFRLRYFRLGIGLWFFRLILGLIRFGRLFFFRFWGIIF